MTPRKRRRLYRIGSKVKDLVNLSGLCNFQFLEDMKKGNIGNQNLPKIAGWEKRESAHAFFVNFRVFPKRIFL